MKSVVWFIVFAFLVPGCSPPGNASPGAATGNATVSTSKLVGTWLTTDNQSSTPDIALKLSPDGSLVCQIKSMVILMGGSFYITGKWREDGDKYYQTLQDVQIIGMNPKLTSPDLESKALEAARKNLPLGKETAATISWSGDNEFAATEAGGSKTVYNRKQ